MRTRSWQAAVLFLAMVGSVGAQQTSAPANPQPAGAGQAAPAPPVNVATPWKGLVPQTVADQKKIWAFPGHLLHGENWKPTLELAGVTAGLLAADAPTAAYFRRTNSFEGLNRNVSSLDSETAIFMIPVAEYVTGLVAGNTYAQRTAVLSGEALFDSEVVATVLKEITYRRRPYQIPVGGNFSDSWVESPSLLKTAGGGFPSGHTIAAFTVATVLSRRYPKHRWMPVLAYGFAALVGFTRLAGSDHYPTDVFAGAALGYTIGRYVSVTYQ